MNTRKAQLPLDLRNYLTTITPQLEKLVAVRNRVMHSRPLDFQDFPLTMDTALDFIKSGQSFAIWETLTPFIHQLETNPEIVLNLDFSAVEEANGTPNNLPTPDFDETGFLGRQEDVKSIRNLCLGPYPVITISGDGGIGKTALALRVAYDLIDDPAAKFDAIVWTSCKTAQLTMNGVLQIENAITTSLGMLKATVSELGGHSTESVQGTLQEILEYLREFRILLIIDNLETVLDQTVRDFLSQLPLGAKILITSRIGVAAYEYPYRLSPLDESESVRLLRAFAKRRRVETLMQLPNDQLKIYCRRMKHNPLYLKWFVTSAQTGKRPEEVLANPEQFLDFAMSNVFDHLSEESKMVLQCLLIVAGARSQAEIVYLTSLGVDAVQISLQQLLASNMLQMKNRTIGSSYNAMYEIPELAQKYLIVRQPIPVTLHETVTRKWRQLISTNDETAAERVRSPYSFKAICTRTTTDLVVAKYLRDALDSILSDRLDAAEVAVIDAKRMAPDFFEVHRVEALYYVYRKNFAAARASYEAAIEIEPHSAPLRTWFGGFLMRDALDSQAALRQLLEAKRIAPSAVEVKRELATAYLFAAEFQKSVDIITEILTADKLRLDPHAERKVRGLLLNAYRRWANQSNVRRDFESTFSALTEFVAAWKACPSELKDDRMENTLRQAISECYQAAGSAGETHRTRFKTLERSLRSLSSRAFAVDEMDSHRESGRIVRLNDSFGFLENHSGDELYFNSAYFEDQAEWVRANVGAEVSFVLGANFQGECAKQIRLAK